MRLQASPLILPSQRRFASPSALVQTSHRSLWSAISAAACARLFLGVFLGEVCLASPIGGSRPVWWGVAAFPITGVSRVSAGVSLVDLRSDVVGVGGVAWSFGLPPSVPSCVVLDAVSLGAEASVFIWASPAVAGGYSRVLALAALGGWSWSTSEELGLVGGALVLPLPLPLGPSRGVSGFPPAVPPSPPRLAAERVLRTGSWVGVGIVPVCGGPPRLC